MNMRITRQQLHFALTLTAVLLALIAYTLLKPSNDRDPQGASAASGDPLTITWWHSMDYDLMTVNRIVDNFNASQHGILVKHVYQGTDEELMNKLQAADAADAPALVDLYNESSRSMLESKLYTPVQTFIDKEKYDTSPLEAQFTKAYMDGKKLMAMPFWTVSEMLYYNKDLFAKAGLNPDKPPVSFEEFAAAAKAITAQGAIGLGLINDPWLLEPYFLQRNPDAGVQMLSLWTTLLDANEAYYFGTDTGEAGAAFTEGRVAMLIAPTRSLRGFVDGAKGKFEVGTGAIPAPDPSMADGVVTEGTSSWIMRNKPKAEQQAAWEFVKYLSSPKAQAYLHSLTGYFPVNQLAYDEPNMKAMMAQYPQFQAAADRIRRSPPFDAAQYAFISDFGAKKTSIAQAIEDTVNEVRTPQEAFGLASVGIRSE